MIEIGPNLQATIQNILGGTAMFILVLFVVLGIYRSRL
jgi:hypothetical protein